MYVRRTVNRTLGLASRLYLDTITNLFGYSAILEF